MSDFYPYTLNEPARMSGPVCDGDTWYFVIDGKVAAYKVDLEGVAFVFDAWFGEESADD